MGTKLSTPNNNRRNHPSSMTANEIESRGGISVSSRNRSRSLEIGNRESRTIPVQQMQALEISSSENGSNDNSLNSNNVSMLQARSLPSQLFALHGLRCPVCSKFVQSDEVELHFVMCLTKPRLAYNADVLSQDSGECVICLEDLLVGQKIARLPCLCIYHKSCIDSWFMRNRSCPEHPS